MHRSRRRLVALGLAVASVTAACSGGSSESSGPGAPSTTEPPATSTTSTPSSTTTTVAPTTTAAPTTTVAPPASTAPPTTAAPRPPVTQAPTPVDPNAPAGAPGQRIQVGANGKPIVALTFDAGSDYGFTDQILDTLKAEGIKATFGMTGAWAEKNPDGFRRIVAEGHHLINHSYSHQSWTGLSSGKAPLGVDARTAEMARADNVFVSLGAKSTKPWYRPPYGDLDKAGEALIGAQGYRYIVMWSVDTLGWNGLSADAILARCQKGMQAGAIILMHVGAASQDANALPAIIAAIRAAGLQPGSVADVVL